MKKFYLKLFFIYFVAIFSVVPCFADNLLQQKAEKEYYEIVMTTDKAKLLNFVTMLLIQDDYQVYTTNGDCLYSRFLKEKEQYCKLLGDENEAKCIYAKQIEQTYLKLAVLTSNVQALDAFTHAYKDRTVKIDDKYFKSLGKNTKLLLFTLSVFK